MRTRVRWRDRALQLASLGALTWAVWSCDLTAPRDRYYNTAVRPIEVDSLVASGVRPGGYLAGHFAIQPDLRAVTDPIDHVVLLVDSTQVSASSTAPYLLDLDTTRWPDGAHSVIIGVVLGQGHGGLAGASGVPNVLYHASVFFDQTAPTPTVVDSVVWRTNHPTMYWHPNHDRNFYAYVIDHQGNYAQPVIVNLGIDSVRDQATATYTDTSITPLYGLELSYYAWVTNRGATALGTPAVIRYGDTIPVSWSTVIHPLFNTVTGEAYVLEQVPSDTLKAISPGRAVTRRYVPPFAAAMALSRDQQSLYVLSYNTDQLTTLDAATFTVTNTYTLSYGFGSGRAPIVAGRAGRLYTTNGNGPIMVVDAATGAVVSQLALNVGGGILAISPDRNTLYVLDLYGGGSFIPVVDRIDVSTDTLSVVSQRALTRTDATVLQLSPDGTRLFITFGPFGNYVDVWEATTLATVGQLAPHGALFDFVVGPDALYTSETRTDPRALSRAGRVVRYDLSTLAPLQSWDFAVMPQGIALSGDGASVYAFGDIETWIVPVH